MSSDFNIALMQIFTAKISGMVMKVCIIIIIYYTNVEMHS